MAINETKSLMHWNYFLALEADIERLSRYVEFTSSNFDTHSIEIAHLLLAASSEVDVVAKQLCMRLDASAHANNINDYHPVITVAFTEFTNAVVTLPRFGLELIPWHNWKEDHSPDWWADHNKVKHHRSTHYDKANLKNVLNAMSGLFLLMLYYYRDEIEGRRIEPPPSLFTPPKEMAKVAPTFGGRMALFFNE